MATNFNEKRNNVLRELRERGPQIMAICLSSENFQAGLQALDPEDRGFVFDSHVRNIIEIGLLKVIESVEVLTA